MKCVVPILFIFFFTTLFAQSLCQTYQIISEYEDKNCTDLVGVFYWQPTGSCNQTGCTPSTRGGNFYHKSQCYIGNDPVTTVEGQLPKTLFTRITDYNDSSCNAQNIVSYWRDNKCQEAFRGSGSVYSTCDSDGAHLKFFSDATCQTSTNNTDWALLKCLPEQGRFGSAYVECRDLTPTTVAYYVRWSYSDSNCSNLLHVDYENSTNCVESTTCSQSTHNPNYYHKSSCVTSDVDSEVESKLPKNLYTVSANYPESDAECNTTVQRKFYFVDNQCFNFAPFGSAVTTCTSKDATLKLDCNDKCDDCGQTRVLSSNACQNDQYGNYIVSCLNLKNRLTVGAKIGIAIGVLLVVALAVAGIFFLMVRRRRNVYHSL